MPHVEILYKQLQKRTNDPLSVKSALANFETEISKVRENITPLEIGSINEEGRGKRKRSEDVYLSTTVAAKEVCDLIMSHCKERFEFSDHLLASTLFDHQLFPSFQKLFPDKNLSAVVTHYPFLNQTKLKTELQIIYFRDDFKEMRGVTDLLQFLIENNLEEPFGEVLKLLKLIATIPMTTAEAERSFSTLKRIKTFLRSTMNEDRLSALAMLSIEKEMVHNLPDFNERVIDGFAHKKERRMDFLYKKTSSL